LLTNFAEKVGSAFTPLAAFACLQGLDDETKGETIRYIREALEFI
jgi:hypothetical protein